MWWNFNSTKLRSYCCPLLRSVRCVTLNRYRNCITIGCHSYTPADIPYIRIYFNTVVRKPLDSESVVRSIDIHWLHPKYDPLAELVRNFRNVPEYRKLIESSEQPQSDIALIRLDKPVRNLPFVPIATRVGNLVGQAATVYGFGIFETFDPNIDDPRSSAILLRGETTILDKNTCAQIHGSEMVDPQYVCAIGTQNSCNVSPLMVIQFKKK